jgi:hypothetical protein
MCIGCLPNEKERQELIDSKSKEAKVHAVKDQKIYIIYAQPVGGIAYITADAARTAGITAIKYISFL